jgi:GT2 family glycosyltransferase
VCVLNNDVVVGRGWLTRLLRVIAVDPAIAAVGPITSNDRDWQGLRYLRQHWGLDLPIDQIPTDDLDQWNRYLALRFTRSHVEIDGMLAFFCTLLRRESIERAGRLDELFDFGGEDDDFCYRLQREGAKLALSLQTYVIHRGGVSAGPRRAAVDERHRRNLARLAKKWPHRYGAIAS